MNDDIPNDKCWTLWQWLCYIYKLKSTCNALTWQLMQVLALDTKTQLRIMAVWNPSHNKNVTQNRTSASPLTSSALLHVYGGSTMCEKVCWWFQNRLCYYYTIKRSRWIRSLVYRNYLKTVEELDSHFQSSATHISRNWALVI